MANLTSYPSTSDSPTLTPAYVAQYSGHRLIIVSVVLWPVINLVVAARFYSRQIKHLSWQLDDYLALVSLVIQNAMHLMGILLITDGHAGHHEIVVLLEGLPVLEKWARYVLAIGILYFISVAPPKLAILALYQRVFTTKPYRYSVYALSVVTISACVANMVAGFLQCQPFTFYWNKLIPGGHCFDIVQFYRWCSIPNILTDVVMLVLPLPLVWNLHASKNIKIGLTFTFLTGAIGLGTSIARFSSFIGSHPLADGTWACVTLMIWTIVESDMYLIAACLPTLRPLLHKITGKDATEPTDNVHRVLPDTGRRALRPGKTSFAMEEFEVGQSTREGSMERDDYTETIELEQDISMSKVGYTHTEKELIVPVAGLSDAPQPNRRYEK